LRRKKINFLKEQNCEKITFFEREKWDEDIKTTATAWNDASDKATNII
jgi:hypothetical protein